MTVSTNPLEKNQFMLNHMTKWNKSCCQINQVLFDKKKQMNYFGSKLNQDLPMDESNLKDLKMLKKKRSRRQNSSIVKPHNK